MDLGKAGQGNSDLQPAGPTEVLELLTPLSIPWWIAGGWALDLFLGRVTRPHGDVDVGIFRGDAPSMCTSLAGWDFFEAHEGALTHLALRTAPRRAVNSLWCRRQGEREWKFELMLDDGGGDQWIFRRDHEIRLPLEIAIRRSAEGVPFLAPEIQLLYKSKLVRPKDQADFESIVGLLGEAPRAWLRASLARVHPGHFWLSQL
ncbi:MAG: hypothetical protein WBF89_04650 [Steroidobacteraceae bacterium]